MIECIKKFVQEAIEGKNKLLYFTRDRRFETREEEDKK